MLATDAGEYTVVCARTGVQPVPVVGHRFPDRETAERAARAAEEYRAARRRDDHRLRRHDLIATDDGTCDSLDHRGVTQSRSPAGAESRRWDEPRR
ncbi:DUF7552 domain-containing protein [Halobellus clavatus]